MSAQTKMAIEPHPKFPTDFLLSEIFKIIDWDFAINFYRTLQDAQIAMSETGVADEKTVIHIEKLKNFFLQVQLHELGVVDKVQEMIKDAERCRFI